MSVAYVACGCSHFRPLYADEKLRRDPGKAPCVPCECTHGSSFPSSREYDSGRYNESGRSRLTRHDLRHPFAEGAFRFVAKGKYTSGSRKGQACAVKWFKRSTALADTYFAHDIKAVNKALEIGNRFQEMHIIDKVIKMNVPEVWSFEQDHFQNERFTGKFLCEPFINNYEKWNSNTGWNDDSTTWGRVMQALSHFSYYISRGSLVLCDLQGGFHQDGIVLTDPVILSRSRRYGVTDLGPEGMVSFFTQHRCNEFCQRSWELPSRPVQRFRPVSGTLMIRHGR